jgi:hypothetical protein
VLGAVTSLERLVYGTRLALRTVPVEVMATFSSPFQALPHPKTDADPRHAGPAGGDRHLRPGAMARRTTGACTRRTWSSACAPAAGRAEREGERAVAQMQAGVDAEPARGRRLQWACRAGLRR